MFSGVGGFELGISELGECIGFSEVDKYAISVYKHHFKHHNYGDATRINPADLPEFDLLVGGFPCQAFSIAGKRAGFADTRGTLFFDIARILAHKRPRHILLENVKGLLSHDSGKTFQTILGVLADLGYRVEWQVLNSKDWGVPQNRERVFIAGHFRGKCGRQILPIGGKNQGNVGHNRTQKLGNDIAWCLDANYYKGVSPKGYQGSKRQLVGTLRTHKDGQGFRTMQSGLSPTIPARARNDGSGQPVVLLPSVERTPAGRKVTHKESDVMPTITTQYKSGDNQPKIAIRSAAIRTRTYANQPAKLETRTDDISNTVDSVPKDFMATDGTKIRRLTPIECERLQGFPDGWTRYGVGGGEISDTQRYKMMGNAVTVNVVSAVVNQLKRCLA